MYFGSPLAMGMFLVLFVGKQVGIFGVCWLLIQCYSQAA